MKLDSILIFIALVAGWWSATEVLSLSTQIFTCLGSFFGAVLAIHKVYLLFQNDGADDRKTDFDKP